MTKHFNRKIPPILKKSKPEGYAKSMRTGWTQHTGVRIETWASGASVSTALRNTTVTQI
jgi:hypothetical protein